LTALPEELLIEVLKHLLTSPPGSPVRIFRQDPGIIYRAPIQPTILHPSVLRTCRLFHRLGIEFLYQADLFCREGERSEEFHESWTQAIGVFNLGLITSMTIEIDFVLCLIEEPDLPWAPSQSRFNMIRKIATCATNLSHLTISVICWGNSGGDDGVLDRIVTLKRLAAVRKVSRVTISGIDSTWCILLTYLSLKLRLAVHHGPLNLSVSRFEAALWSLESTLLECDDVLKNDFGAKGRAKCKTLPNLRFTLNEDIITGAATLANQNEALLASGVWDQRNPNHSVACHSQALEEADAAHKRPTTLWEQAQTLQLRSDWPTISFFVERQAVSVAKFRFLKEFWDELKSMGIVVPRERGINAWETIRRYAFVNR
jgi:hypothetical protein